MLHRFVTSLSLAIFGLVLFVAPRHVSADETPALEKIDSQGYKVEFESEVRATAGRVIAVDVAIEPSGNVNYAALYYRRGSDRVYKPVVMRKTGRTFTGEIPSDDALEGEIKYYVRVTDKRGDNLYLVGNQRKVLVSEQSGREGGGQGVWGERGTVGLIIQGEWRW